jgi:low affinity Fe/Cu permease
MIDRKVFTQVSTRVLRFSGRPEAFFAACLYVVAGLGIGLIFDFNETWLAIFAATPTLVTFLMVFLIQDSQNRDTAALHLKLDQLIRATATAKNELLDLEHLTQEELDVLLQRYKDVARRRGHLPTPEVDVTPPKRDETAAS